MREFNDGVMKKLKDIIQEERERILEREYTVNLNAYVVATSRQEAIEKVKNGEIHDILIIDVLDEEWGG